MADFRTALEALGEGKITVEALSGQLDKLLSQAPHHATRLLAHLDDALDRKRIDNRAYTELKRQINHYRRTHAEQTEEGGGAGEESTVFDRESNFERGAPVQAAAAAGGIADDSEAVTEVRNKAAAAPAMDDSEAVTEIKDKTAARDISEDVTESRAQKTVVQAAGDRTEVVSQDVTAPPTGGGVDFDISSGSFESGEPSSPSATGPTGTGWQTPATSSEAAIAQEMGPGSVIKDRFQLLEVLGVGGMGKVYKGLDLLKQEARDKQPYIALKLLNEDFKSHPEAFIALQRESSRQQKLAHPNIATVYDFDRIGGRGTPVYITMELMEGQPLNTYIKKIVRKQGGLPFPEAYSIVKQLGAALQYAHERRLVHSDFKPGNAFLCNDGVVKTLDFGIARAVKNPLAGSGEKTLFDPGKLGALTPAYASLEMLEGEEPDPRDDIYALGCVAYELLTGNHPFNKLPATTAKENGLVPPLVKGLNKKQNRALRKSVAFRREDRTSKVEEFIEDLEGKANLHKNPFFWAAAATVVIGIMSAPSLINYFHKREIASIVAEMSAGNKQVVVARLTEMKTMDEQDRKDIAEGAKQAIQRYYSGEIAQRIDIGGENYDFPAAEKVLTEVAALYPESLFLQEQQREVGFNRKQKLSDLYKAFIDAKNDPSFTKLDSTQEILKTLARKIDPNHPLIKDPGLENAYRLAADQAFTNADYPKAMTLIASGLNVAPGDARLTDLQAKVQRAVRVAELSGTLSNVQVAALTDLQPQAAAITELGSLASPEESPALKTLADATKAAAEKEIARVLKEGARADAEALASQYGSLLSAMRLNGELTQFKLAHLKGQERSQAVQQIVAADRASIEERLAAPNLADATWESELLSRLRELDTLQKEDASLTAVLQGYKEKIGAQYAQQAATLLQANRFDAADELAVRGQRLAPDLVMLQETRTKIADTRAAFEKQQRINDMKEQFNVETDADRVAEAQQIFDQLKTEVPDDDFVTRQGPSRLADAYQRLAERSAEGEDYAAAMKLAEAGLLVQPRSAALKAVRDENRAKVNNGELTALFRDAQLFTSDEVVDMARKVSQIEDADPEGFPAFRKQAEDLLSARIRTIAQTDENSAAALAEAAVTMFPTSNLFAELKGQYELKPWPGRNQAYATLDAGELTKAGKTLEEANAGEYKGHPDVVEFEKSLQTAIAEANDQFAAYEQAKASAGDSYEQLRQAKKFLLRAQAAWTDNPEWAKAEGEIDQLIAASPGNPAKRQIARETVDIGSASEEDIRKAIENWTPVSSGRECNSTYAGYGKRAKAICYDLVYTGWRGPMMVVVPPTAEGGKTFAIGKFEISVGDWSKYCALSLGKCKPVLVKERLNDPQTGISLAQAQEYVEWLSKRTGKKYRLPTPEEWEYAASQGGKLAGGSEEFRQIKGTLNCRVTMGDKILKGTGTASVTSGMSNDWGLKNFVGNVQEIVLQGEGEASARGGAFSDSISNCDVSLARPVGSGGDDVTGFRVVLDEVG
jgi:serine/threonine protein kinase